MSQVSNEQFRNAMARVAGVVTVVTTTMNDRHHATTVSAFASLSADPPMVMLALSYDSSLLAMIRETQRFGVNVLSEEPI